MSLLDPSKCRPASVYPTLALLNNFLLTSHEFLNSFSERIDKKLGNVSSRISQLEILLSIIEAKLNSIPDSDTNQTNISVPVSGGLPEPQSSSAVPPPAPTKPTAPPPPSIPPTTNANVEEENKTESETEAPSAGNSSIPAGMIEACNHPTYAPFIKMLKVGVPAPVVMNKLTAAGLDPSVVNDPNKLIES